MKHAGYTSADVWDIFAIGSDFDKLINHLDSFESSAKMHDLKTTMHHLLQETEEIILFFKGNKHTIHTDISGYSGPKYGLTDYQIVSKIFSGNAMGFLERNF